MAEAIVNRDPGDEGVPHPEVTGLCARPWCNDAAIPGGDFCIDCEGDVENMRLEAIREARVDELVREVKERERWFETMAELYGDTE